MKFNIFLFILIFYISQTGFGQTATNVQDDSVYVNPEIPPSFPGGYVKWVMYESRLAQENAEEIRKFKAFGTCIVRLTVKKDGSIANVKAITMENTELAKFLINVIIKGPKWLPALQNEVPVSASTQVQMSVSDPN